MTLRQRIAARRLARQYAIEMILAARDSGEPLDRVTAESVVERMKADGLEEAAAVDWLAILDFVLTLIERLQDLFGTH